MKLVLIGKSNAGKTYLAKKLEAYGRKEAVSTTSRPQREGEVNHVHYHFISKEEFEEGIANNAFAEVDEFNGWYYGLTHQEIQDADMFVLTPRGLHKILQLLDEQPFIIYLESTIKVKLSRILTRDGMDNESQRRWVTDDKDFDEFDRHHKWDMKIISNETEGIEKLLKIINK